MIKFAVKDMFLDRPEVVRAIEAGRRKALGKAGGYLRLVAQRSMKTVEPYGPDWKHPQPGLEKGKRKRKLAGPSRPGEPPHAIRTHPWLKKKLYYSFDAGAKTVVVGPERLGKSSDAPHRLEFGGSGFARRRNPRRIRRGVGDGGEIRIGGRASATTKLNAEGLAVSYATIRTVAQADRANQLNEQLYGPMWIGETFQIEARPYMAPALEKSVQSGAIARSAADCI